MEITHIIGLAVGCTFIGAAVMFVFMFRAYRTSWDEWEKDANILRHLLTEKDIEIDVLEANVENWELVIESLKSKNEEQKKLLDALWRRRDDEPVDPTIVTTHWSDEVKSEWKMPEKKIRCGYCGAGPSEQCAIDCGYPSLAGSQ